MTFDGMTVWGLGRQKNALDPSQMAEGRWRALVVEFPPNRLNHDQLRGEKIVSMGKKMDKFLTVMFRRTKAIKPINN